MKKCNKCGKTKEYLNFFRCSEKKDGYQNQCKPCFNKARGTGITRKAQSIERRNLQDKGLGKCYVCLDIKSLDLFSYDPRRQTYGRCRKCSTDYSRRLGTSGLTRSRENQLWYRYRLTVEVFQRMVDDQQSCCKICRASLKLNEFVVDHDHDCCIRSESTCGHCVRGLLCSPCNKGLGLFRDNRDSLLRAAEYLVQ